MTWDYEKLDENLKRKYCPINDPDGSITGRIVMGVKAWFDENPEERKRRGWIKHIKYTKEEIDEKWPHNKQSQYLIKTMKQIDPYTVEDEYHVVDKTEEMMLLEELLEVVSWGSGNSIVFM